MLNRLTQHAGTWLSLVGTNITTNWQSGTVFALEGDALLDIPIVAVFDAATDKTTIDFRLEASDDAVNGPWIPIQSMDVSIDTADWGPSVIHSLAASAGATVYGRLQVTNPVQSKFFRMSAKYTGGTAPKSTESATSQLNYDAN